ncbi:putative ribonuclease H protein [Nymphaea thermarum]|nr:putative ribonuclease H protein [Nymphaea thermarum]
MPPLTPRTSSFAHLLSVSSISFDSSFCTDLPSLHIQLLRLSRGSPHYPASLPLPPVSHALPHIPCVDSFSPALRSDLASASTPPSSPAQLPGATTRPVVCHSLLDRLPPVAPLLDVELGISLPDALAALKVSLPQEQLDLLCSSFVAAVAPVSRSSLARLRRELRRIGASAASILPPGAARAARRTSRHNGPSVLIVVETKMSVVSHACVRTLMRQPSFGFLPANGTAGGILLAWSPPLTGVVVHIGRYSISASLSGIWPNGPVLVTAVYGPCVGALRGQLWAELHQVRQLAASPWLLAGDFNCLLSPADSSSPVSFGQSMSAFRSFVDEFGLFDVPSTNGTFTWSNNRNPPILRRLDHIFLSPELFSAFPSSSLDLGPRHLSDHAPLLLSLHRGRAGSGPARFRFELSWLRDESFVATIPIWWARAVNGRWAAFRLSRKLHFIRRETLAWKRIFWSSKFSEKLNDRLQCWQGKLLSLPGRITLAKHCLASVPLHALAVFRPPVAVLSRFNKLIRKFIWDGDRPSDHLAHWDVVAFPRILGGAGVTNLSRACESSLCSWWWRLATEHSPITQFIISKFDLPSPSGWNSSISHVSPSHFWCDMLSVLPLFLRLADLSSSTSPSWPLSLSCEFTFSSCYIASFGPSVSSLPPSSLWSPGPSPRATAFVWLLLNGHINTFDHLQRLGISLANQCPLCLVATESRVHLFTSCHFFYSVLASTWPSLVNSLPNPSFIRLLFLFCPSPRLAASWGHVWRPWLISAWWRIWEERNNRVFRGTFSSPDSVARRVQGDVQFAIRLKRRCSSVAG